MGHWLTRFREYHNWTQAQAAEKLEVSRQMVSKVEAGKAHFGRALILEIADEYHASLSRLGIGLREMME